jgi:hypothetical protein
MPSFETFLRDVPSKPMNEQETETHLAKLHAHEQKHGHRLPGSDNPSDHGAFALMPSSGYIEQDQSLRMNDTLKRKQGFAELSEDAHRSKKARPSLPSPYTSRPPSKAYKVEPASSAVPPAPGRKRNALSRNSTLTADLSNALNDTKSALRSSSSSKPRARDRKKKSGGVPPIQEE